MNPLTHKHTFKSSLTVKLWSEVGTVTEIQVQTSSNFPNESEAAVALMS